MGQHHPAVSAGLALVVGPARVLVGQDSAIFDRALYHLAGRLYPRRALLLGLQLFVELTPDSIVWQHLQAMGYEVGQWEVEKQELDAIEAEYEVKEE